MKFPHHPESRAVAAEQFQELMPAINLIFFS
jgi:hypothetical protein